MVSRIIAAALRQRFLVLVCALSLLVAGFLAFRSLPVDAYPDLSPPKVEVITSWDGHAAEEVERLITIPLETAFNGIPGIDVQRSISLYGLSDVILIFNYTTDPYFDREQVFQRMGDADLPDGASPGMSPLTSPSGLIYRYVLDSPDRSAEELKVIQDWVLYRRYKSIPGVADDSGMGGTTRQYQVQLDPLSLNTYGVDVADVVGALANNNENAGGGFYQQGGQFYNVRGLGRLTDLTDIGNVVVSAHAGVPIRVGDLGKVALGAAPRLGQFGYMGRDDAVEGVIFLTVGEAAQTVLQSVEKMTDYLNQHVLPADVQIHPYYDRTDLIKLTTRTVLRNLLVGISLVTLVLVLFLRSLRSGLIVAMTIPLALATAFLLLKAEHIPVNLLSLGAVDFGILVDAAVIMIENIWRELGERHRSGEETTPDQIPALVLSAAKDVGRPIFYATAVIIAAYLPIYALTGPSERLFSPMADTVVFALLGTLLITLTVLPALASLVFRKGVSDEEGKVFEAVKRSYARTLDFCLGNPKLTVAGCVGALGAALLLMFFIGAEFMPKLDEGALWVRATMPPTVSFDASSKIVPEIRKILMSFPEVTTVASEHGRPDDGTNPIGFYNSEFFVGLKPYNEWTGQHHSKDALIADIDSKLSTFPGIIFNYTQPAEDAVDEASTGLKSSLAVKVFGTDLKTLEHLAEQVSGAISKVPGIDNVTIVRELGQPSLDVKIDPQKIARYGLDISTINGLIEAGVGGVPATSIIQGERQYDLVVRLAEKVRNNPEAIGRILVTTPNGQRLPLSDFATLSVGQGASFVYREDGSRYIGVQYSVEGRDLASGVADAQAAVKKAVTLPSGYEFQWGGEYSDFLAARDQMAIIVPLTFVVIFFILFALYGNLKYPLVIALCVLLTMPEGGLLALWTCNTNLSVSSGLGFLALFGVSVQSGVIFTSYADQLRKGGMSIEAATRQSALVRLRPILMTAFVECVGLLPAAFSHDIGSDSQRPFAQVVVGGLLSRVVLSIFLMPVLYRWVARETDVMEA